MKVKLKSLITAVSLSAVSGLALADFVHNDEVIVVGSLCVGVDCVNGESFNYDTIRMKENNTRIKFQDTSSSASFPSIDWQITANDSANGGKNYYAIENIDTAKKPLMIESGSDDYSIFVRDNDWVGFKTNAPSVTMQVTTGNSPTLRLEQDGSSGFAAQSWDVAGNETNFFIRDVSNASQLPLRIRVGAPTGSVFVDVDGDFGLGTITPDGIFDLAHPTDANNHAVLVDSSGNFGVNIDNGQNINSLFEIQSAGGTREFAVAADGNTTINGTLDVTGNTTVTGNATFNANVYIDSAGYLGIGSNSFATSAGGHQPMLKINGITSNHNTIQFDTTSDAYTNSINFTRNNTRIWMFSSRNNVDGANDAFYILGVDGVPFLSFFQDGSIGLGDINGAPAPGISSPVAGRAIITGTNAYLSDGGTWTDASSRDYKQDIEQLSTEQAMNALEQLEPVTFSYKVQPDDPHAGFIAEDVPDIVATPDRKSLSSMDIVAVLTKVVKEQQATIKQQKQLVEALTQRIEVIETNR